VGWVCRKWDTTASFCSTDRLHVLYTNTPPTRSCANPLLQSHDEAEDPKTQGLLCLQVCGILRDGVIRLP
jgi:hypothetical protein